MTNIAVFGSAFNPPHRGHIDAIEQLLPNFDHILVIPSAAHAFGKNMVDFTHRYSMTKLIIEEFLATRPITVLDIEATLVGQQSQPAPIYSFDLLIVLQALYPTSKLTLAIGPDNAKPETWQRFYRYQDIEQQFAVTPLVEQVPYRSTTVREKIMQNRSQDNQLAIHEDVGHKVAKYIHTQQLYRTK